MAFQALFDSESPQTEKILNVCLRGRRLDEVPCLWCQEQVGVFSFMSEQKAIVSRNASRLLKYRSSSESTPIAIPLAAVILLLVSWAKRCIQRM